MGAGAGAVTISAAVGAATAAGAAVVDAATVAGATVVGAAAAAGAGGVRRKTLHKTCKAVATVISEEGDGNADKAARDSVAAARTAGKILAAGGAGAAAAGDSRADEAAEAAGVEPARSGMVDTSMSERGRSKPERSRSRRAVVAASWRCEIKRLKLESARTGDTGVAE